MTSQDVARRMLEEHKKVEKFSNRLREWVAIIPRTDLRNWIAEARARFDPLRAHFVKRMAMEEKEGYLVSVSERRPTLAASVDRLKHEHREFCRIMEGIHRDIQDLHSDDLLLARDCGVRIGNLLEYIEHHEEAENLLVTLAFSFDVGTHD